MKPLKARKVTRAVETPRTGSRYSVAAFLLLLPVVCGLITFLIGGGVDQSTTRGQVVAQKSDCFGFSVPDVLFGEDPRIAETTACKTSVTGTGDVFDPFAPSKGDSLLDKSPTELAASPAEIADDDATREIASADAFQQDPLNWGAVGEDPTWRSEIAPLENECVAYLDAPNLWGQAEREAESNLALDSDILSNLHSRTLAREDGTMAYPVFADDGFVSKTAAVATAQGENNPNSNVTTAAAETPVDAKNAAQSAGYNAPRVSAWAPSAVTAGSFARAVVY